MEGAEMIVIESKGLLLIDPVSISVSHTLDGSGYVVAGITKDNRTYSLWPFDDKETCKDEKEAKKVVGYIGNLLQQRMQKSPLVNVYVDMAKVIQALGFNKQKGESHADT